MLNKQNAKVSSIRKKKWNEISNVVIRDTIYMEIGAVTLRGAQCEAHPAPDVHLS